MTEHLYILGIGPVQGFISAARRTRDLWMGSHLLSEISKAAARQITEAGGVLIFPALDETDRRLKASPNPDAFNVANIIYARLPGVVSNNIPDFNNAVKAAAKKEWLNYAKSAKKIVDEQSLDAIDTEIWDEQVQDVIEFYAAWVPLGDKYDESHQRLMRLFGSRKSLRNFQQASGKWRVEKSSLDGARECVLNTKAQFTRDLDLRMRLTDSEQLCAVGLTKRLGGSKVPFPSVVRVAADPWIRGIMNSGDVEAKKCLQEIGNLCEGENRYASGAGKRGDKKFYAEFPFDGQILYPSRLEELKDEIKKSLNRSSDNTAFSRDLMNLEQIEGKIETLCKGKNGETGFGVPSPYLAVLIADGDRMGKVISNIKSQEKHHEFSKKLAEFARTAREIVEDNDHHGVMVFAGGEDILAFLPVDTCLDAARRMHREFSTLLEEFKDPDGNVPTLSVGIAIGHSKDPLEDLLEYGHDAEVDAKKPDRDGLAIHFHTRSGGDPIQIREQWSPKLNGEETPMSIDDRLDHWVALYIADQLPDGAGYDLRQLAEDYRGWEDPIPELLIVKDMGRLLGRKQVGENTGIDVDEIKSIMHGVTTYELLVHRAEELVLSRKITEIKKQAMKKHIQVPGAT